MHDYFTTERLNRFDFDARCSDGHYYNGVYAFSPGCKSHALAVITRRTANDPGLENILRHSRQLVVGAAQFEREYRLQILPLHQDTIFETQRQVVREVQRCFARDVIYSGVTN